MSPTTNLKKPMRPLPGRREIGAKQPAVSPASIKPASFMTMPEQSKTETSDNLLKINGFRRDDLIQLQTTLKTQADATQFTLRARNRWIDGAQTISLVSSYRGMGKEFSARHTPFIQTTDTPQILLGKDLGPSPIEELLVALAASVTTTLAYRAAAANIIIEEIECDTEADINFSNALDSDAENSQTFEQIRVTVRVKSAADLEQFVSLCAASPVLNALTKPIPVTVTVQTN